MKEKAAIAAVAGPALLFSAPVAGCMVESAVCNPAPASSRDSDDDSGALEPRRCTDAPEIEEWSARRGLDPVFVRAIAITQSNLDACAAARSCDTGVMDALCIEPGPQRDRGYEAGLDEMHDPSGRCPIENASPAPGGPAWRWLGLGLMQTLEPPYTFWPAAYNPDGVDGQYSQVLQDSQPSSGLSLDAAQACNPRFNPFNAGDSACLGTFKIARMQNAARAWIASNRDRLGLDGTGEDDSIIARIAMYVTAHMYYGTWSSATRRSDHPRCSSEMTNGNCWAYGYAQSRAVTDEYCGSSEGQRDSGRCENGMPRNSPPVICGGHTDFVQYVRECEVPYLQRQGDYGATVLRMYEGLRADCRIRGR